MALVLEKDMELEAQLFAAGICYSSPDSVIWFVPHCPSKCFGKIFWVFALPFVSQQLLR